MRIWVEPNVITLLSELEFTAKYDEIPVTALWMENQESMILAAHPPYELLRTINE